MWSTPLQEPVLDRLLMTLDVAVEAFAICEVRRGLRLLASSPAIEVHYVLSGTMHLMVPGQPFAYLSFKDHRTKFRIRLEKFPVKITPLGSFEFHELLLVEPLPLVSPQSQTGSSTAGQ